VFGGKEACGGGSLRLFALPRSTKVPAIAAIKMAGRRTRRFFIIVSNPFYYPVALLEESEISGAAVAGPLDLGSRTQSNRDLCAIVAGASRN
jgi:hypothetical protein